MAGTKVSAIIFQSVKKAANRQNETSYNEASSRLSRKRMERSSILRNRKTSFDSLRIE